MPKITEAELPRLKTDERDFIALTSDQLLGINQIAKRAADGDKEDDQFNGGSIQYVRDEFFQGEQLDGIGVCDPDGVHCVAMCINLAADHYRLLIMAKKRFSLNPVQIMIDVDAEMMSELSKPEYSYRRFLIDEGANNE